MQAMILAAGFGTRLKPYTDYKPKPLFPILNKPLLLLTIERLKKSGFKKIIVNCHHLKEQIVDALSTIPEVIVQQEEKILGTGGGLRNALPTLSDEPLLIVNGDIYHTVSYEELYSYHCQEGSQVTMALHDLPRFNKVNVEGNYVTGFNCESTKTLAFTGIHVINPNILKSLKPNTFSCVIDLYKSLINNNKRVRVYRSDHAFWSDMGTPEDYIDLHNKLFLNEVPRYEELDVIESNYTVGKDTLVPNDIKINDWCCIGDNVKIGSNVRLSRSIVWDNAQLEDESNYSGSIVIGFKRAS